jgi:cytochrome c oxidase subunit 1
MATEYVKYVSPESDTNIVTKVLRKFRRPDQHAKGIINWLTTIDHKKIGIMYGVSALFFLIIGGIEALLIRSQLWDHNMSVLTNREYNQMFTMHGTTMVFLVIMPLSAAFFNYLMPLQIGARDVAFP